MKLYSSTLKPKARDNYQKKLEGNYTRNSQHMRLQISQWFGAHALNTQEVLGLDPWDHKRVALAPRDGVGGVHRGWSNAIVTVSLSLHFCPLSLKKHRTEVGLERQLSSTAHVQDPRFIAREPHLSCGFPPKSS